MPLSLLLQLRLIFTLRRHTPLHADIAQFAAVMLIKMLVCHIADAGDAVAIAAKCVNGK